jgi:site-specific DNA recombinase
VSRLCALYARVSTDEQVDGFSLSTQVAACRALAEQEGYTVTDATIFQDEGVSGTTLDRPALKRMRQMIYDGALAAVCVLDPDNQWC